MRAKHVLRFGVFLIAGLLSMGSVGATVFVEPADTVTQSLWRTGAWLEGDGEYGTDGYVVYGLNAPDNDWVQPYDPALTNTDSLVSLPAYIADVALAANNTGRWSGNGNFGYIEDPSTDDVLTPTPVIAWGAEPYVFTITRASPQAFRLVVIYATGDGQMPTWTATVDDGSGPVQATTAASVTPGIFYQVFDVSTGTDPITVSVVADTVNGWITGFAFDPFKGFPAGNPSPADDPEGTTKVPVDDVVLSWDTGLSLGGQEVNEAIRKHYLYTNFANPADPNLYLVAEIDAGTPTQPSASYGPIGLERDQIYRWQIEEGLDDGQGGVYGPGDPNNILGPVWTFHTVLSVPMLVEGLPGDQVVDAGGEATFEVEATNPFTGDATGLTYQWYKDGDLLAGATEPTLVVTAVQDADEGTYVCRVTISDTGAFSDSKAARLTIKRLIAHWPLDGDPNDVVDGYGGSAIGEPAYVEGVIGQAMEFDGVDDHIVLPAGLEDLTTGLTLSVWARPTAVGTWARFVDFSNGLASDNVLFTRAGNSNDLAFEVYQGGASAGGVTAAGAIELDTWQLFTVTLDTLGNARLYKNGILVAAGTVGLPNVISRGTNYIGRSAWDTDALYTGQMDDLRLYNHALTPEEVADLYVDVMGPICPARPDFDVSGPDGEPDCRVNLLDLAAFAESWLVCGEYPTCITEIPMP